MPLSKREIDDIGTKCTVWDRGRGSVAGFGVRCQAVSKVFVLKYSIGGRARWYTIGRFGSPWSVEEARTEARRLLGLVATGTDPAAEKQARKSEADRVAEGPLLLGLFCDQYLTAAKSGVILTRFKRPIKASTLRDDEGRIRRHIKPLLGDVPLQDIDRQRVGRMIADIAAGKTSVDEKTRLRGRAIVTGGHTAAARTADLLSGILTWAVEQDLIAANPARGVRRFRGQGRERFLSWDEIANLGRVVSLASVEATTNALHPAALSIIDLLCLSGCRLGEVANLRWSEVDELNQCLRLEDTKTGRSMRPVGKAVLERLRGIDRRAGSPFVFPASRGDGAYQGTKRQAKAIFEAAGIEGASSHTLRHTFGSVASDLGYSDATIAGLLGHAGRGMTSRYTHRPDEALRSAADAVATRINDLLTNGKAGTGSRSEAPQMSPGASEV